MELDTSGFATQGPTVYAGNIGENRYIVQVSPLGIRLLEGGECRWPWLSERGRKHTWDRLFCPFVCHLWGPVRLPQGAYSI